MNYNKRVGSSYECLFSFEALQRGLHPHNSIGDYLGHDTAVMNDAGKFYRVNVKGTNSSRCSNGGKRRYEISVGTGRDHKKPLDCTKVDIIAVFIQPSRCWYLVPCLPVSNLSTLRFYPDTPGGSKAITEPFRDDWSCFFQ
jgi:hypothetical protein